DCGKRLVVDFDQVGGVGGDVAIARDDDGDGMPDVIDAILGEDLVIGLAQAGQVGAANNAANVFDVGACVDRDDAGERRCFRRIDGIDGGRAVRAAHDHGVIHAGKLDVVDVGGVAGEE